MRKQFLRFARSKECHSEGDNSKRILCCEMPPSNTGSKVGQYQKTYLSQYSRVLSRSGHRTPNSTNPKFFVYSLFEYFFQIKVLN